MVPEAKSDRRYVEFDSIPITAKDHDKNQEKKWLAIALFPVEQSEDEGCIIHYNSRIIIP